MHDAIGQQFLVTSLRCHSRQGISANQIKRPPRSFGGGSPGRRPLGRCSKMETARISLKAFRKARS